MGLMHVWIVVAFFLYLAGTVACTIVAGFLWRKESPRKERGTVIAALAITAAWCVTNAAWGAGTAPANLLESVRNVAGFIVLYRLLELSLLVRDPLPQRLHNLLVLRTGVHASRGEQPKQQAEH